MHLTNGAGAELEGPVLRIKAHLARKEFEPARRLAEETIARFPNAESPRVILSYVYLQEGNDPTSAEQSLREILVINPENAEAKHNLEVLLNSESGSNENFPKS
ncbi:MAG TPA: hypothetical protein VGY77_11760 [Gemmataceae bacterium]|nr:hypothetical protein [Gemmataceae bacterium]